MLPLLLGKGILSTTYYITVIHKALIYIYRYGLIFLLTLGSGCQSCIRHKETKELPRLAPQTILGKKNTTKPSDNSEKRVPEISDEPNSPELLPTKKPKRIARVEENKQAILLLHGLSRHSSDFHVMMQALKQHFPHAKIVALTSVEKDSNNPEKASTPSVKLSIKDQAEKAYEEVKEKIPYGSHLVIVGHSQGGLRAFAFIKKYGQSLKDKYGMVIHKLITIGTPWKGAPFFRHVKNVKKFNQKFNQIEPALDSIQKGYGKAIRGYFFKKIPGLAKNFPKFYEWFALSIMEFKGAHGALDLDPESNFIRDYVAEGLKEVDVPITAIAGVLTDFSKLFEPFPSSISPESLAEINATYAELIGGNPRCDHDMLLPISTQHAEGLITRNFKRIKVDGACHGNKVGISVKRGLSELNHKKVIEEVIHDIETTFYQQKDEEMLQKAPGVPAAA